MSKTFTEYEPMKNIVSTTSTNSINQIEITVPLKEDQEDEEELLNDLLDRMEILESKLDTLLKICDRINRNL
jgi:hypothetical protein